MKRPGFSSTTTSVVAAVGFAAIGVWPAVCAQARGSALAADPARMQAGIAMVFLLLTALLGTWLHRRNRATRRIQDALAAFAGGERDLDALRVGPGDEARAAAFNDLLVEVSASRVAETHERAMDLLGCHAASDGTLASALGALWQGVIVVDAHLRVVHSNPAASVLLGVTDDGPRELSDFLEQDDIVAAVRVAAGGGARGARRAFVIRREDEEGSETILRVGVRTASRNGEHGAVIFIEDATQQTRSDEARNTFVSQATHELRGPLANIQLYVETAMDDGEEDAVLRGRCLNVINQESRRLDRLVADMLSIAEIEAGSMCVRVDDVRTDQLFEELANDYKAQAVDHGITAEFHAAPKMPVLRGDRDKIAVVLHNLINNAIKYTPEGGRVTVTAEASEEEFVVEVADTGFGIAADQLDRIFDRFHRATDDERVAESVGTGLGLALARDIARMHGGDITVESEPDLGSRFRFRLPIGDAVTNAIAA